MVLTNKKIGRIRDINSPLPYCTDRNARTDYSYPLNIRCGLLYFECSFYFLDVV